MELDSRVSTPALMLSGDGLEASNNNWTFESVRANFCVGRSMYLNTAHPSGWYYEVTILSTGIMQIGDLLIPYTTSCFIFYSYTSRYENQFCKNIFGYW